MDIDQDTINDSTLKSEFDIYFPKTISIERQLDPAPTIFYVTTPAETCNIRLLASPGSVLLHGQRGSKYPIIGGFIKDLINPVLEISILNKSENSISDIFAVRPKESSVNIDTITVPDYIGSFQGTSSLSCYLSGTNSYKLSVVEQGYKFLYNINSIRLIHILKIYIYKLRRSAETVFRLAIRLLSSNRQPSNTLICNIQSKCRSFRSNEKRKFERRYGKSF